MLVSGAIRPTGQELLVTALCRHGFCSRHPSSVQRVGGWVHVPRTDRVQRGTPCAVARAACTACVAGETCLCQSVAGLRQARCPQASRRDTAQRRGQTADQAMVLTTHMYTAACAVAALLRSALDGQQALGCTSRWGGGQSAPSLHVARRVHAWGWPCWLGLVMPAPHTDAATKP